MVVRYDVYIMCNECLELHHVQKHDDIRDARRAVEKFKELGRFVLCLETIKTEKGLKSIRFVF